MKPYLLAIAGGYLIGNSQENELFAKGGKVGASMASSKSSLGGRRKFVWIQEQGDIASGVFSQESFEEIYDEILNDDKFNLVVTDDDIKVFERKSDKYRITFRLKSIF